MYRYSNNLRDLHGHTTRGRVPGSGQSRTLRALRSAFAAAVVIGLAGPNMAGAAVDIPSDLPPSPLTGLPGQLGPVLPFAQQMLRFEEFGVHPLPAPGTTAPKNFPLPEGAFPAGCISRPNALDMDAFLDAPIWPDPTREANLSENPWHTIIAPCQGFDPVTFTGVMEGRPPGESFAHQRWNEFFPVLYFETAMGTARAGTGIRDDEQSHSYSLGEFAPGGLYHNVAGIPATAGTAAGIDIRFHPNLPVQNHETLWTFGDGTLPPKLLRTRYAQPILLRHYNALPIDATINGGFGEHTITTHEHNGHNPGEVDGFAGAYFFPGQFYDYRWPMQLAGYDSINTDASDPRAATPCSPGEVLMISNPVTHVPEPKTCDPATLTVKIPGDWRETMSTHWFHDHMIDRTSENVYKGNAAMMNYYSAIDRGKEGFRCDYDDTPTQDNVNLCFPSGTALDWGNRDYDIQLLVAAKAWNAAGQLDMAGGLNEDGFLGDMMTVNWLYEPYMDVRPRRYRFRILNGAVARFFKFAFVEQVAGNGGTFAGPPGSNVSYNQVPVHMIANDGNILEHAVPFPRADSLEGLPVQSIAERYDVIIDFSQLSPGVDRVYMVNTLAFVNGRGPKQVIPLAEILDGTYAPVADPPPCANNCWSDDPTVKRFMEFRVAAPTGAPDLSMNPADYEVGGKTMIPLVPFTQAELDGAVHRTFHFGRGGSPGQATDGRPSAWGIVTDDELADGVNCLIDPNDPGGNCTRNADINTVSAAPETMGNPAAGEMPKVEIWHITSGGGWGHPVHIHFEEGQYLNRDGAIPPDWEAFARKDMYRVSNLGEPGTSLNIDVAIRFREFAGTFVEHCHNTTHEDKAMLLRWDNELPGQTSRIPTPIPDWDGVKYVSVDDPFETVKLVNGVPTNVFVTGVEELATFKTGNVAVAAASDLDGDLVLDAVDNCILAANPGQEDSDGDAVGDACDNCTLVPNGPSGTGTSAATQRDTDGDGFGNRCDADFNGDGVVNLSDYSVFRSKFGANGDATNDADFNGDGRVNLSDYSIFRSSFGGAPGPSALVP